MIRQVCSHARFDIDEGAGYESTITTVPSTGDLSDLPEVGLCLKSGKTVPKNCLARCQITGATVLRHLLAKSEISGREILPEYMEICGLTGKQVAQDELTASDVSGRKVITTLLRKSEVSGKLAEPDLISRCAFTNNEALKSELGTSELSGRKYRLDQETTSGYSGKRGHTSEFMTCTESRQKIARTEAEQCEETKSFVRLGVLVNCSATGKRVLPSQCNRCSVTNKIALKKHIVISSVSGAPILGDIAVHSLSGSVCSPSETQTCAWTGQKYHPDDLGVCTLTGLSVYSQFLTEKSSRLRPLYELLINSKRDANHPHYPVIEGALSRKINVAHCHILSGAISPSGRALAICGELKGFLGLTTTYLGCVFSPHDREIVGRVASGKRSKGQWIPTS